MADIDSAFDKFFEYIFNHSEILKDILEGEIYDALLEGIEGATRDEILEIAKATAAQNVSEITRSTMEGLAEIIANGLENQLGVQGTARDIRDLIGLNKQQVQSIAKLKNELLAQGQTDEQIEKAIAKETKRLLKERSEIIAQAEMRKAISEGEKQVMESRGAKYKVWITSRDSLVSDVCQRCEAQGAIPINDAFSTGAKLPPHHPRCRCTVSFITSDSQRDRANERAKERAETTAKAKESTGE